ncbi:MAG: aminopeptidase [Bacillaceae bacterium]|nr:aminopeptidase [Bacillaceae bacterium]
MDPRMEQLARQLVRHSIRLQKGENVLIEVFGTGDESRLARAIIKEVYHHDGIPYVQQHDMQIYRALLKNTTREQLENQMSWDKNRMEQMDAYIGIRGGDNHAELSDVPEEKMTLFINHYQKKVHTETRVPKTKWVILRFPTPSMAQSADMSTEAFEDFYYQTCTLDYSKMEEAVRPLKALMEKTDTVRITGPGTDLTFSIKDMPVIPCTGEFNIPDGEIFTAPVRDSVNGKITYNTPSQYLGTSFENVSFEIRDGKIVNATANHTEKINHILDSDEGARYFGEFALGLNPYILHPMKDTLFDEKIAGSFHFTPGNAYDMAFNGNRSSVHWDLVNIQRPEYGGGEIYFDDVLIRKDGEFVLPELKALNPENLKE